MNPATGEQVGSVPVDSAGDVAAAVARIRANQPAWEALGFKGHDNSPETRFVGQGAAATAAVALLRLKQAGAAGMMLAAALLTLPVILPPVLAEV